MEGIRRLVESDFTGPVNIGSEEMVTIDELAQMAMRIAGKSLYLKHVPGPLGVRGRNSDNQLIERSLGWKPSQPLEQGVRATYEWIALQIQCQGWNRPQARFNPRLDREFGLSKKRGSYGIQRRKQSVGDEVRYDQTSIECWDPRMPS